MSKKVGIIGAGPAGHAAALRLARMGAEVTVFEKDSPGGTCLNRGCIPAKCLLSSAEAYHNAVSGSEYGFSADNVLPDAAAMVNRKCRVVKKQLGGMMKGMAGLGIKLVAHEAALNDTGVVVCQGKEWDFDATLIAAGSAPLMLRGFDRDDHRIMTSNEIMDIHEFPGSVLVIGAGYIGLELGCWLATCGVDVDIAEAMPAPLPGEEPDMVKRLVSLLKRRGIRFHFQTRAEFVEASEKLSVRLGDLVKEYDIILMAAGRVPVAAGFLPESILENNAVRTDNSMKTDLPGVWAAGDCTGGIMLAHAASAEGIIAAMDMAEHLGLDTSAYPVGSWQSIISPESVPAAMYTTPELASVGIRTHMAEKPGMEYVSADCRFASNGRAAASGSLDGMIRLVVDKSSRKLKGASILGSHASELIHELALAINSGLEIQELTSCIHGHPTLSEAIHDAAVELLEHFKPERGI